MLYIKLFPVGSGECLFLLKLHVKYFGTKYYLLVASFLAQRKIYALNLTTEVVSLTQFTD